MKLKFHLPTVMALKKLLQRLLQLCRSRWAQLVAGVVILLIVSIVLLIPHHRTHLANSTRPSVASTAKHSTPATSAAPGSTDAAAASSNTSATVPVAGAATTGTKPATARTLVISPSTITMSKKPDGMVGAKAIASSLVPLTISTPDGSTINLPFSADSAGIIMANTHDPAPYKQSWPMTANATYAPFGTTVYTLTATTAAGVKYTGTVQVTVNPMPVFTITGPATLTAHAVTAASDVTFDNLDAMNFDFSQVSDYMPTMTFAGNGWSCTASLTDGSDGTCNPNTDYLPNGVYSASLIFENQFQKVSFPVTLYIGS